MVQVTDRAVKNHTTAANNVKQRGRAEDRPSLVRVDEVMDQRVQELMGVHAMRSVGALLSARSCTFLCRVRLLT